MTLTFLIKINDHNFGSCICPGGNELKFLHNIIYAVNTNENLPPIPLPNQRHRLGCHISLHRLHFYLHIVDLYFENGACVVGEASGQRDIKVHMRQVSFKIPEDNLKPFSAR